MLVTAEHVQADAQHTPIAMSVYNSSDIKRDGIYDISDLTEIAPDVNFSMVQGASLVTMRGISSRDTTENGDPAVTISTDGFYLNSAFSLDAMMYDLDRVEVLRGPQGTLQGRNSVGGAINVITAAPTTTFETSSSLEYGNFNDLNLQGMVNLPLSETVQLRASFLSVSHDGYRDNYPQTNGDDEDAKSGRIEVAFQPFTDFKGLFTVQYTNEGGAGDVSQAIPYIYSSTGALVTGVPPGINANTFSVYISPTLALTEKTYRLKLTYDIAGAVQLTALGGYDKTDWQHNKDATDPPNDPPIFAFLQGQDPATENLEFRATSIYQGSFQWQAGAFYFHDHSHLLSTDAQPLTTGGYNEFFGFNYYPKDFSRAVYAQGSYQFTDALKLTAGLRHTSDYKAESGFYGDFTEGVVYANESGSATSTKTTYHVALDYNLTTANMLYAKYDTGYKAGGFNFGGGEYKPESDTAYEIGSKNRFLDNTLELNTAAFLNNYTDEQVSTYAYLSGGTGSPVELTENAGASKIWGLETDFIAKIPVIGTLSASVDYLHARYTYFLSVADPSDPTASGNVQLAGNTPPQAPTWSFGLALEQSWAVPTGVLTGRIQSKLESSSNFSFYNFPDTEQRAYSMSNAFMTYAPSTGNWKVTAFIKNLENSAVFTNAEENLYRASYTYAFYPPRTYGLRLEYAFDGR